MELSLKLDEACDHSPDKWSIKAVPSKAGHGFLLSIPTITCRCGVVANITDSRGKRSPATTLGVDFLSELPKEVAQPPKLQVPPPTEKKSVPPEPLPPGPGTEMALELERLGMSSCQQCKGLAKLMNDWGPQGCRERLDEIVADVLPRARAWFDHATFKEKLSVWWNSNQKLSTALAIGTKASTWELDDALKEVIKVQVLSAIDRFEKKNSQS